MFGRAPLVSVILASYNHAQFVERAAQTVLQQEVPLELIVIDDASTDGTPDIVARIQDPRIKLVRLEENCRYQTRNLGLEQARGKFIAFQNSYDEWSADKLPKQLQALEKSRQNVACFTDVALIDQKGEPAPKNYLSQAFDVKPRTSHSWLRRFFEKGNCLCITSALLRQSALKKVGNFKTSLFGLSDLDMWVRLAGVGEFAMVPEPLTKMRILPGRNLSQPTPQKVNQSTLEFADVLMQYTEEPLLKQLPEIFDENFGSSTLGRAALVKLAWTLTPAHRLFADRVAAALLDNPQTRAEVIKYFGTEFVREFIKHRQKLELHVTT